MPPDLHGYFRQAQRLSGVSITSFDSLLLQAHLLVEPYGEVIDRGSGHDRIQFRNSPARAHSFSWSAAPAVSMGPAWACSAVRTQLHRASWLTLNSWATCRNGRADKQASSTTSLRNCWGYFDLPDTGNVLPLRPLITDQAQLVDLDDRRGQRLGHILNEHHHAV